MVRDDDDFEISGVEREAVFRIFSAHGLLAVDEEEVRLGDTAVPSDVERLAILLGDQEWCVLAWGIARRTLHTSRVILARWAQLLIASKESSRALTELADLMEDLRQLRSALSGRIRRERSPSSEEMVQLIAPWRRCFVNASVVYEDLALSARHDGFVRWSFRLVQPPDQRLMETLGVEHDRRSPTAGRIYTVDRPPRIDLPGAESVPPDAPVADDPGAGAEKAGA